MRIEFGDLKKQLVDLIDQKMDKVRHETRGALE